MIPNILRVVALALLSLPAESRSYSARLVRRTEEQPAYIPVSPSTLAEHEIRTSGYATEGGYVVHGLGAEMDMVTKEYGLRDSESFYWGLDGKPLANVTAFVDGKNVRVLSMERFDNVLEDAKCSANSIELTFTKEVEFDQVQTAWSWIDEADDNYVVLVTESSRCNIDDGDATIRQPWHITHADFDDATNVVTLTADPKTWDQAFSKWHLEADTRGLIPESPSRKRSLNARSSSDPDIDLEGTVSSTPVALDSGATVACESCSTSGGIDYRITNADFDLDDGFTGDLEVFAYNLGAHAEILTHLPAGFNVSANPTIDLSLARLAKKLTIREINLDIGPVVTFGLGITLESNNEVDIRTGLDWKLNSPEATYQVHFSDGAFGEPTIGNWDSTTTPLDLDFSDGASLSGSLQPQLGLSYHGLVEISNIGGGVEAGLILAAPILYLNGNEIDQQAACGNPSATAGVNLEVGVGAELLAQAGGEVSALITGIGATATATIFSTSVPVTTTCIAITAGSDQLNPSPIAPLPTGGPGGNAPYGNSTYPFGSGTCTTNGALVCRDDTHFGLCNFGRVIWQPVAPGTGCYAGSIVGTGIYSVPTAAPTASTYTSSSDSACTNGVLYCNADGTQYALCNWGQLTFQPVAQGTTCQGSRIVGSGVYGVSPPVVTAAPRRF